jgi:methylmalonyl-CoA mutase cobalamin-binding subunit
VDALLVVGGFVAVDDGGQDADLDVQRVFDVGDDRFEAFD